MKKRTIDISPKNKADKRIRRYFEVLYCLLVLGAIIRISLNDGYANGTSFYGANVDSPTMAQGVVSYYPPPNGREVKLQGFSQNIWVGGQPDDATSYKNWMKANKIGLVIRLNMEDEPVEIMDVKTEEAAVSSVGAEFITANIDAFSDHTGKGFHRLMLRLSKRVLDGDVFIHCRGGHHRAPTLIMYSLLRAGFSWDQGVDMIEWDYFVSNPGDYKRYLVMANSGRRFPISNQK